MIKINTLYAVYLQYWHYIMAAITPGRKDNKIY